jgi:hypothetical protein
MAFRSPSLELNLYRVEILHDIDLVNDGYTRIVDDYSSSPFFDPEIFPSTRVGRWNAVPHLDGYVELDYGQNYQIKIHNYTWRYVSAVVYINGNLNIHLQIDPNSQKILESSQFTRYGTQSDLIEVHFQPEKNSEGATNRLIYGQTLNSPISQLDTAKSTVISVRLVAKRRYDPNKNFDNLKEECPSYIR